MTGTVKSITIEGFKSIRRLHEFELGPLNVLIGSNGAGKSNFISFFRLLKELVMQRLQSAIAHEGGADAFLFLGPKESPQLYARIYFGRNGYEFRLVPTSDGRFYFTQERTVFFGDYRSENWDSFGLGHYEARLKDSSDRETSYKGVPTYIFETISDWVVYHFHDTSATAGVRRQQPLNNNVALGPNAENLAAFLYKLKQTHRSQYLQIRDTVRLAAPFFDDFLLRPIPGNEEMIQLEWRQRDSDYPFKTNQLSDGTLRFMCLATVLLQPDKPSTMLFDEPELGLHPYALTLLGNLFRQVANEYDKQLIISTQSVLLLNEFEPSEIIVVDRQQDESIFKRLKKEDLESWLEEYSLSELWQKNVLGGRPASSEAPEAHPRSH